MNPISALIDRMPVGDQPTRPPQPPPLSTPVLAQLAEEAGARPRGLGGRLLPSIADALAARLEARGEAELPGSFDAEARASLPPHIVGNYVGRAADRQDLNPAERTLKTAAWARAAAEVLAEFDAEHPELQLRTLLRRRRGRTVRERMPGAGWPVAIAVQRRFFVHEGAAGKDVAELGSEIGATLAANRTEPLGPDAFASAPLLVLMDRRTLQVARHAHQISGLQGPWACLSQSSRSANCPPLELLGASEVVLSREHLVELGVRILERADQLLDALPDGSFQWLGRALTRAYVDSWRQQEHGEWLPLPGAREEHANAAWPGDPPSLERLVYAVGVAAQRTLGGDDELSPTLLATGQPEVLTAVRFTGGQPEPFEDFAARFADARAREQAGNGPVADTLRRALGQAAPEAARARLFQLLLHPGPVPGPFSWVRGTIRVGIAGRGDAPFRLYVGSTPPAGGGLAVNLAPGGELGIVATGPFTERGRLDRFVELIEAG